MNQQQANQMQYQLRRNTEDLQEFIKALDGWESEIKQKDESLRARKPILKEQLPPVRNQAPQPKKKKKVVATPPTASGPGRISSYDYRSWDRFNVDKACEDVEYQVQSSEEDSEGGEGGDGEGGEGGDGGEGGSGDEELEEEQRRQRAVLQKDKGNALFKQGQYELSVESYSTAMELDPLSAVLPANRAMALIKLHRYSAAEQDCTTALILDPSYVKAYHRRGLARTHLDKLSEAKKDFQAVLRCEPGNKLAKSEIAKLERLIAQRGVLATSGSSAHTVRKKSNRYVTAVERPPHLRSKKPLKRVWIEDIGEIVEDTTEREKEKFLTPTSTEHKDTAASSSHPAGEGQASLKGAKDSGDPSTAPQGENNSHFNSQDTQTSPKPTHISSTSVEGMQPNPASGDEDTLSKSRDTQVVASHLKVLATTGLPDPGLAVADMELPGVPTTSLQFQADWKRLRSSPKLLSQYFKSLPLSQYPTLLQQSLETDIFTDIITILHEDYIKYGIPCVDELEGLSKVKRFAVSVMFLARRDKDRLQELFRELNFLTGAGSQRLSTLGRLYQL